MNQRLINDIIQWDVKNWARLIEIWRTIIEDKELKNALALGEREGGLSLWLALNNKNVTCTDYRDFKNVPLELHSKHKVEDKVNYSQEDATNLSFENDSYDIVIFKSMLGALGTNTKQKQALKEAYRVLKPGGYLLFAENLKASRLHQFARKKFISWGENWHYPSLDEIQEQCSDFESFEYETHGLLSPFGRSENQRKTLSLLDHTFRYITPESWRYILFGIAQK